MSFTKMRSSLWKLRFMSGTTAILVFGVGALTTIDALQGEFDFGNLAFTLFFFAALILGIAIELLTISFRIEGESVFFHSFYIYKFQEREIPFSQVDCVLINPAEKSKWHFTAGTVVIVIVKRRPILNKKIIAEIVWRSDADRRVQAFRDAGIEVKEF